MTDSRIRNTLLAVLLLFFNFLILSQSRAENSQNKSSIGTCWPVNSQYGVTNYHVVADMENIHLITTDKRKIPVNVIATDKINDLAIVKAYDSNQLPIALPLAKTQPNIGSSVFTIGYPLVSFMGQKPKLTTGIINALTGLEDDPRIYQISVPVQPGNSGGPLINMNGEVIGVITSKLNAALVFEWTGDIPQNVNYAVKLRYLNALLEKLNPAEDALKVLPNQTANLEMLANRILNSIMIITGTSKTAKSAKRNNKPPPKKKKIEPPSMPNPTIEPENIAEGKLTLADIEALFSDKTAKAYHNIKKIKFIRYYSPSGILLHIRPEKGAKAGRWHATAEGICIFFKKKGTHCQQIVKENGIIKKYKITSSGKRVLTVTYDEFINGKPENF